MGVHSPNGECHIYSITLWTHIETNKLYGKIIKWWYMHILNIWTIFNLEKLN